MNLYDRAYAIASSIPHSKNEDYDMVFATALRQLRQAAAQCANVVRSAGCTCHHLRKCITDLEEVNVDLGEDGSNHGPECAYTLAKRIEDE